jgi:hypothetical protein
VGRTPRSFFRPWAAGIAVAFLLVGAFPVPAAAASYPPLPPPGIPLDRKFLSNLSAPSVGPGDSTRLNFTVTDPSAFGATLTALVASFQVYAFNGFPGNATAILPVGSAPVLVNATISAAAVSVPIGSLSSGAAFVGSIGLTTSTTTPAGTFAIRTALSFDMNGTAYLLESRGWFSLSVWEAATTLPNGSATLNLTTLGVSGVVPETAVLVAPSGWPIALAVLLAVGFALVAAGAWRYFRRTPASRSGAS